MISSTIVSGTGFLESCVIDGVTFRDERNEIVGYLFGCLK